MKLFGPLYRRAIGWSRDPRAPTFLVGLSFVEAIIFPVPPEVMLAPMSLAQPKHAMRFATLSLIGSLVGAVLGYLLGHYAYEVVRPLFDAIGWADTIDQGVLKLRGIAAESPWKAFWLLALVGFALPLKIVTWASGIVGIPWLPFLASMVVGRGHRVYPVALAIRIGGERAERALHRWIEPVGWAISVLLLGVVGYFAYRGWAA